MDFSIFTYGTKLLPSYFKSFEDKIKDEEDEYTKTERNEIECLYNLIKNPLKELLYITTFGRGFWAGALDEYTIVYNPKNDKYFIVHLHFDNETFSIKYLPENSHLFSIFTIRDSNNYFTKVDEFFTHNYRALTQANITDLGLPESITKEEFLYEVWWDIASLSYDYRNDFRQYLRLEQKKNKINHIQKFYEEYKNQSNKLSYQEGNLYIVFEDGTTLPLNV